MVNGSAYYVVTKKGKITLVFYLTDYFVCFIYIFILCKEKFRINYPTNTIPFPFSKGFFAKGKMLGAGRHPTGPE